MCSIISLCYDKLVTVDYQGDDIELQTLSNVYSIKVSIAFGVFWEATGPL